MWVFLWYLQKCMVVSLAFSVGGTRQLLIWTFERKAVNFKLVFRILLVTWTHSGSLLGFAQLWVNNVVDYSVSASDPFEDLDRWTESVWLFPLTFTLLFEIWGMANIWISRFQALPLVLFSLCRIFFQTAKNLLRHFFKLLIFSTQERQGLSRVFPIETVFLQLAFFLKPLMHKWCQILQSISHPAVRIDVDL